MGSEHSQPSADVQIDAKCVETTDYWTLFNGELPTDNNGASSPSTTLVSLFQGEPVVKGQLWTSQSPLDRAAKNLMIYRHPSILRFISSSIRGSKKVLVTERCSPLSMVLATQSDVQICLGLRNILCSLVFLVEQGGARHLNVCLPSVYVTTSGAWRLAGFEHIWKSSEVNANLLEISQPFRSKATTDVEEINNGGVNLEQYSYARMCEEILKAKPQKDPMPYLTEFLEYCSSQLRHKIPQKRPSLSSVLQHPYLNHEFVIIHSFLSELPLKNASDKLDFFTNLIDRLRAFDEHNVAIQLADLLLSRMVLLDPTAQLHVIPHLLSTRSDSNPQSLFSPDVFTRCIVPRILQLFGVLDAQTRLILLEYFGFFVKFISNVDLKDVLLPQLLLGIKDKNDILVAATLRSLAELVPILGAGVVIGRNRSHVFADGRPQAIREALHPHATSDWMDQQQQRSITPVLLGNKHLSASSALLDHVDVSESLASNSIRGHLMPERLSPDGGEDEKTASDVPDLENDAWSDWEHDQDTSHMNDDTFGETNNSLTTTTANHSPPAATITKLVPTEKPAVVEIDFFADMEPVIQKTCVLSIDDTRENETKSTANQSRLLIQAASGDAAADVSFGGWDDDVDEWGD